MIVLSRDSPNSWRCAGLKASWLLRRLWRQQRRASCTQKVRTGGAAAAARTHVCGASEAALDGNCLAVGRRAGALLPCGTPRFWSGLDFICRLSAVASPVAKTEWRCFDSDSLIITSRSIEHVATSGGAAPPRHPLRIDVGATRR